MSTKAELMTVITAVIILLPKSNVHIYIDFKAIIDEFLSIQSSLFTYFNYARPNFKDTYLLLWFILFSYINQHHLSVTLHKVKAHNNNYWNDYTDQLAKATCDFSSSIIFLNSARFNVIPMYNHTAIMIPL